MRKYMNIINRLLFGAVALAALSCTGNFETYNRNPDQPSTIDRDVWDYIKSMQYNVIPTVKNQYQIVENVSGGAPSPTPNRPMRDGTPACSPFTESPTTGPILPTRYP